MEKRKHHWKIKQLKECNFYINVNDMNQWEQKTSLKVCSVDDLKQKIIVPINHKEIVEDLIEKMYISLQKKTLT